MLDKYNVHAKSFRMVRDRYREQPFHDRKLRLIEDRTKDGRVYNIPTVSEVATLIVGDVDTASPRDIIMESRTGKLQRINELHTSYLGYQYPLLFPYGEDGYTHDINHRDSLLFKGKKRNQLTIKEWFSFRIQTRDYEAVTLLRSRRLIKNIQSKLIVDKYINIFESSNSSQNEGSQIGKRFVLPSTFVGGRRFMDQLYFDGMAICSHVGFPDLFLTY